ncbi:hypothetical protein ACTORR_24475 [Pseudomonas sp. SAR267]|uniref:hypothetical protein n=1 Tax=Pseudomonas sp. SAR267 TaxID=3454502 RepID=UPI003F8E5216
MPNRPSWLTVGVLGLALTAATHLGTVAFKFGQQDTALAAQAARNQELSAERDRLYNVIGDWKKAYESQQSLLQAAQADVVRLKNDRCNPIYDQVYDLKQSINFPRRYGFNDADVANFHIMLQEFQRTLQACYQAK